MNYFLIIFTTLLVAAIPCSPQPKSLSYQNSNLHSDQKIEEAIIDEEAIEIEDLVQLCAQIAESTNSSNAYTLQRIINQTRSKTIIPMRSLIRMVRYAGITLKICEAQHDLPIYRIQQLSDLLSTYWAAIWERWNTKNVYPVNLELLARLVETTHATQTDCPPHP